jgi:hypothetical protein
MILITNTQHGLGNKLKNRQKWNGMIMKKVLFMMSKPKRKNCIKHKKQKIFKSKYNKD